MYRIYTLVLRLGLIVAAPFYLARSRKYWPTLSDRLGLIRIPQLKHSIWIHAVSVGEVKAVERLVERIRAEFPGRPVVMSTATPTGQQLARDRGSIIDHTIYFPFDIPGAVRRTLNRVSPELVIITETEIWPNFLRLCAERRIPVMLINGRISDRSLPRYRLLRRWLRPVFENYTVLGMQSELDRQRIESIGARSAAVTVFGNLKYDISAVKRPLAPEFERFLHSRPELWIAASTMPGEDELLLNAFQELRKSRPRLQLMLAPRHPERTGSIVEMIRARALSPLRRSAGLHDGDVLVLDTIGELALTFRFAAVVFMGGSLVPSGGHNILEPAQHSKPVIFGPHMENFRDISRLFLEAGAAIQITGAADLPVAVKRVLDDPAEARLLGERAHQVVLQNTGATDRVIRFIRERIPAGPRLQRETLRT